MSSVFRENYPLFLPDFKEISIFGDRFSKNNQVNSWKIHPVGVQFFHSDWQTDRQ